MQDPKFPSLAKLNTILQTKLDLLLLTMECRSLDCTCCTIRVRYPLVYIQKGTRNWVLVSDLVAVADDSTKHTCLQASITCHADVPLPGVPNLNRPTYSTEKVKCAWRIIPKEHCQFPPHIEIAH